MRRKGARTSSQLDGFETGMDPARKAVWLSLPHAPFLPLMSRPNKRNLNLGRVTHIPPPPAQAATNVCPVLPTSPRSAPKDGARRDGVITVSNLPHVASSHRHIIRSSDHHVVGISALFEPGLRWLACSRGGPHMVFVQREGRGGGSVMRRQQPQTFCDGWHRVSSILPRTPTSSRVTPSRRRGKCFMFHVNAGNRHLRPLGHV